MTMTTTMIDDLLGMPELASPSALLDAWVALPGRTSAWSPREARERSRFRAKRAQLRTLYEMGFTLLLERVERFFPAIRELCWKLEHDLGLPLGRISMTAICANEGAGVPARLDSTFQVACQIVGSTTLSTTKDPAVPMRRGNVVCLPPGTLHEARVDGPSLALWLSFVPPTLRDDVVATVRTRLRSHTELRVRRVNHERLASEEVRLAAAELRAIADQLERAQQEPARGDATKMGLRPGLHVIRVDHVRVVIRTPSTERSLEVDPEIAEVLEWAARQGKAFALRDAARTLSHVPEARLRESLAALMQSGLVIAA